MENQNQEWVSAFSNKSLNLILFMTEQCNFRCVYCYEDFKLGNIRKSVLDGVKNLIRIRSKDIENLSLSFFGGEPLMNKAGMLDISGWAKEFCETNGINYESHITTNAYSLDVKTFDKLIECGVNSYQITVDGEKAYHDETRPTINGKPTFDKIMGNLQMMVRSTHDFGCAIRLNVADSNFQAVKNFVLKYASIFANDSRFFFHFHPIFGMPELELTRKDEIKELEIFARSFGLHIDGEPPASEENIALEETEKNQKGKVDDYVCYAAKADSYTIRADGRVQKCTVALNSELNNIGRIHKDGTMDLDTEKLKMWLFANDKGCPLHALSLENLIVPYEEAGEHVSLKETITS